MQCQHNLHSKINQKNWQQSPLCKGLVVYSKKELHILNVPQLIFLKKIIKTFYYRKDRFELNYQ